ncbi:MAG: AAA family ATPase [Caldilineaceae bacterium]|nr:AAA family ATPase [Caldilineaceae bacterium]
MIHLQSVEVRNSFPREEVGFPFTVPSLASLSEIRFQSPVTFLVGENGSGKSTFLEALAAASGSIAVGSAEVGRDETLSSARQVARHLKLAWGRRTHRGFFLRAEDFFGFAKRMGQMRAELEAEMRAVDVEYKERSEKAKGLAKMGYARELHAIRERYGDGLDARSHGESFLTLFQSRFVPDGLYLLDEPEAPLSPLRQVGFLSLLKEMVAQDAQFIIATHSPILMAFPDAEILSFDHSPVQPVKWDELEHVSITRSFLNAPEAFLRHL